MDVRTRPAARAIRRRTHVAHQPRALDIAPLANADFLREAAAPLGRLADVSTVDFLMRLQRMVGNANLQRFLQRDPKLGWDASARQSKFNRTRHTDPNRVVDKGAVKLRNVLLQGLKHGYNDGEPDADEPKGGLSARGSTVEDAAGKAVVWLPETFKPNAKDKPVEVLLHMHGYGAGYRELTRGTDYAQNLKPGQTRDEDWYKLPDQLAASMKGGARQVVAVLPQGRAKPKVNDKGEIEVDMFGDIPSKPDAYLDEVFAGLNAQAGIDKPASYQLVLSGHSGSGRLAMAAANKLESKAKDGVNQTAGGSKVTLGEIVLFDAIHGTEINTVKTWLRSHIQQDLEALKGKSKPDAAALQAYFSARTRFRGYYSPNYKNTYEDLRKILADALGPVRDQLGDTAGTWFEWQYRIDGPLGEKAKGDNDFTPHEKLLAAKNEAKKTGLVDEMMDLTSIPPALEAQAAPAPDAKAAPTTPTPDAKGAPAPTTPAPDAKAAPAPPAPTTPARPTQPAPAKPTQPAPAPTHRLVANPAERVTPTSNVARVVETYAQRDPRRRRRRGGRRGGSTSTPSTRKPSFRLSTVAFVVDGTSIVPRRGTKTDGWTFTPSGSGVFAASRAMPGSAYIDAAGTDTQLQEETTIHVAGTSARADASKVVMSSGGTPQVTITLNSSGRGTTKSVAVGPESVESLDLTLGGGFTPKAGDTINLARGKRVEVFVFSSLKDPTGKSVSGFFDLGRRTKIQGGFGVEGRDAAPFDSTFTKLKGQSLLNADILANQDVFSMTSEIEGGFATVQSADTGVVSFGFGQWTAMSDLPKMLKRLPSATFQQHLGQYGLGVGTPTLGAFAQARKFIPGGASALNAAVKKLKLHNATEGCLILDGKELVSEAMHKTATDWSTRHDTVLTRLGTIKSEAAAAQADVASGNAAKATAGRTRLKALDKEVNAAWKKLAGLPGVAARVPSGTAVDAKVTTLVKGVTDAKAAADQVVSNTGSVELLRTNEWVLRFQVAGGDPTVQTAQLEEAQATLDRIDAMTFGVTNGVSIGKLLPSQRAQALLFSTFLNSQVAITRGVPRAISAFKDEKVAAAPAGSPLKNDWKAFVWPQADPRWARLFTDANKARLEELAEDKLLPFTFDPARRRRILAARFPP